MDLLTKIQWLHIVTAICTFFFGFFLARAVAVRSEKALQKKISAHQAMLVRRLIFYLLFILFFISALRQVGFQLSVILGAAGIFTVAIGFASQTAASNLVSGIFLLFEQPFKAGNTIEVNGITGTVYSIDLLSTKLKTADGLLVRIPNESMIKANITNISYFPVRRFEITVGVAYNTPIEKVKSLLLKIAQEQDLVLETPEPQVLVSNYADSAIELRLRAWTQNVDNFTAKNEVMESIKTAFDEAQIEIPFPQLEINNK